MVWCVDDLKVSHKSAFDITKLAGYLDNIYPGLEVNRLIVHDYLGMIQDFTENGNVKVSVIPYLNEILCDFLEHLGS